MRNVLLSLVCLGILTAGQANAGHLRLVRAICPDELKGLLIDEKIRIPVGCEVVDCCPGCPGPPLDWHIFVSDPVELTFENLPSETREKVVVEGNAKWTGETTLLLSAGRSVLRGFPAQAAQPPVANVAINADAVADKRPDTRGRDHFRFEVRQQLGEIVVNETSARYSIFNCPAPPGDRLRLDNNAGANASVALLDARRSSGCVNDQPFHLTSVRDVGSVSSNGSCNSEVAVFSPDDAMQLRTNVNTWTSILGDVTPVDLTPDIRNTPLTVWIMRGTFANTNARLTTDRARASQLFNTMGVGTIVSTPAINDATGDADTAGLLDADCDDAANLRSRIGFTAGRLNVYYLDDPGARGWWCGNNTIIIGSGADNESLAHEIGHAFTLDHTNTVAGIPSTNLMITGGTGRNSITKGQAFRCNLNPSSTMNTNGTRTGITRNCPDGTTSTTCPSLALNP